MGEVVPFRRPPPKSPARHPASFADNPYWLADALHLRSWDRALTHGPAPSQPASPDDQG
ncbi:MAG: hypothetical protein M5U07_05205 [Xanthobacteraceae bacterium]|nr:hypothetical protein [Xanthobacteraceae bacterium]